MIHCGQGNQIVNNIGSPLIPLAWLLGQQSTYKLNEARVETSFQIKEHIFVRTTSDMRMDELRWRNAREKHAAGQHVEENAAQ